MSPTSPDQPSTPSAAKQLAGFIARFDADVAAVLRSTRAAVRKLLPTANELVYDNYNFLVIGYCASDRPSHCIVSLAASARGVVLSFYYGATLPDPKEILLGSGNQNRYIRLPSAATLKTPAVRALIRAAIAQADVPLPKAGGGRTVVKSVSASQRPRRRVRAVRA